jgi:hypothetical protein
MSSLFGGDAKQPVADYYMSLHYGVCLEPVDAFLGFYYGEKEAWTGEVTSPSSVTVNRRDLFGGVKKEGGVQGTMEFLFGGPTQVLSGTLASKLGKTPATAPGFRGLSSVFFYNGSGGFLWSSNNPYLREIWIRVRRIPKVFRPDISRIGDDANPACIIYECLTNSEWGMGASSSMLDNDAFDRAAQTLFDETFGLSMMWVKQTDIESFVREVLDHIQATLFVNPRNGLITLKLIREDYNITTLPIYTPDNARMLEFQRKVWGELANEIVVTWTNPSNEKEETVILQDIASVAVQGAIISDSRNYYGVRNAELATRLCGRDLRTSSTPLASCSMEIDRTAWNAVPGDVVKVTWPEYGMNQVVMRIGQVDYGKPGEQKVKVALLEDIFSLATSQYVAPGASLWVDPSSDPEPFANVQVLTAPAYMAARYVDLTTAPYPEVSPLVFAAAPNDDTYSFELLQRQPDNTFGNVATLTPQAFGRLTLPMAREAQTILAGFGALTYGESPAVGMFVLIGSGAETAHEIAYISAYSATVGYTLLRGCLDTVPREWPATTPIWLFEPEGNFLHKQIFAAGETAAYKLLSQTSLGILAESLAPVVNHTMSARLHLPNRPANVRVLGSLFGPVVLASGGTQVGVTWSNRNRLLEDSVVLGWTAATMAPETGQTTLIQVCNTEGVVVTEHADLTGTSFNIPLASFDDLATAIVRVRSRRDGLNSLQGIDIQVSIADRSGYSYDWGNNWGGGV